MGGHCRLSDEQSFDDVDLIPVKISKDAKWSMVNDKGEVVYDGEFTETPSIAINGVFSVKEKEGYSVYKSDGKKPELLVNLEKLYAVGIMEDGLMPVVFPKSRISVVDASGKKIFEMTPVKNQEVVMCGLCYSDGMLAFKLDNGKFGFYDQSGKVAVDPVYDNIGNFNEGLAIVGKVKNDSTDEYNYSVIDRSGKMVFKLKDSYKPYSLNFNGGYFIVKKEDRLILIDKKGEEKKLPARLLSLWMILRWKASGIISSPH